MLRTLAIVAAVAVPVAMAFGPIAAAVPGAWVPALIATLFALPIVAARREARTRAVFGTALAALAAATALDAGSLMRVNRGDVPHYDLREAPLPETAGGFVTVEGHLRDEWVLDEYRVAEGARPDQNAPAPFVLVPLLGSTAETIEASPRIVVARLARDHQRGGAEVVALTGALSPLPQTLLDTLFSRGAGVDAQIEGVILDITVVPTSAQAWTRIGLVLLSSLLALALLLTASARPKDADASVES